jgi:GNAT superfamily N-acetyltransferase
MAKISLALEVKDANLALKDQELLKLLRRLTLGGRSGMNRELDNFSQVMLERPINCKILLASYEKELIAWALLSKEESDFDFLYQRYNPEYGFLFEVFVDSKHRRKGVATELIKLAKELIGKETLCICPWDYNSNKFYDNFNELNNKIL